MAVRTIRRSPGILAEVIASDASWPMGGGSLTGGSSVGGSLIGGLGSSSSGGGLGGSSSVDLTADTAMIALARIIS